MPPLYLLCHRRLFYLYESKQMWPEAKRHIKKAKRAAIELFGNHSLQYGSLLADETLMLFELEDISATTSAKETISILGYSQESIAAIKNSQVELQLGKIFLKLGTYYGNFKAPDAILYLQQALSIFDRLEGKTGPHWIQTAYKIASVYNRAKKPDLAKETYDLILTAFSLKEDTLPAAVFHSRLASHFLHNDQIQFAKDELDKSNEILDYLFATQKLKEAHPFSPERIYNTLLYMVARYKEEAIELRSMLSAELVAENTNKGKNVPKHEAGVADEWAVVNRLKLTEVADYVQSMLDHDLKIQQQEQQGENEEQSQHQQETNNVELSTTNSNIHEQQKIPKLWYDLFGDLREVVLVCLQTKVQKLLEKEDQERKASGKQPISATTLKIPPDMIDLELERLAEEFKLMNLIDAVHLNEDLKMLYVREYVRENLHIDDSLNKSEFALKELSRRIANRSDDVVTKLMEEDRFVQYLEGSAKDLVKDKENREFLLRCLKEEPDPARGNPKHQELYDQMEKYPFIKQHCLGACQFFLTPKPEFSEEIKAVAQYEYLNYFTQQHMQNYNLEVSRLAYEQASSPDIYKDFADVLGKPNAFNSTTSSSSAMAGDNTAFNFSSFFGGQGAAATAAAAAAAQGAQGSQNSNPFSSIPPPPPEADIFNSQTTWSEAMQNIPLDQFLAEAGENRKLRDASESPDMKKFSEKMGRVHELLDDQSPQGSLDFSKQSFSNKQKEANDILMENTSFEDIKRWIKLSMTKQ